MTKSEVQKWFTQGHTALAERTDLPYTNSLRGPFPRHAMILCAVSLMEKQIPCLFPLFMASLLPHSILFLKKRLVSITLELSQGDELVSSVPELLPPPTIPFLFFFEYLSCAKFCAWYLGEGKESPRVRAPRLPWGSGIVQLQTAWYVKDTWDRKGRDNFKKLSWLFLGDIQ